MQTPLRKNGHSAKPEQGDHQNFFVPETPLLKKIGYGTGVGIYHLSRSPSSGKSPKSPWAIKKVLRKNIDCNNFAKLIRDEASLLRKLNHPNIVGFRGFTTTDDGREVLAMEECTESLGDIIEQRFDNNLKMFSAVEISTVCLCVSRALNYLHNEVMLMHGDIKSYNILINDNFKAVKLCDFGVSVKVDKDGKALDKYIGTDIWSAPEVFSNENVTTKADIFSLGIVIFEMIELKVPHFNENDCTLAEADKSIKDADISDFEMSINESYGKRPELSNISLGDEYSLILNVYNSCTEQDPALRPSAEDLINKFEKKE